MTLSGSFESAVIARSTASENDSNAAQDHVRLVVLAAYSVDKKEIQYVAEKAKIDLKTEDRTVGDDRLVHYRRT